MEELLIGYAINDGEICSLNLGVEYTAASNSPLRQASVALLVRKKTASEMLEPCLLQIRFSGVRKVVVHEEFDSFYYSDAVFKKVKDDLWYLSLDPHGNSGEPSAEDNLVIVAESIEIEEGVIQDRS